MLVVEDDPLVRALIMLGGSTEALLMSVSVGKTKGRWGASVNRLELFPLLELGQDVGGLPADELDQLLIRHVGEWIARAALDLLDIEGAQLTEGHRAEATRPQGSRIMRNLAIGFGG